MAVEMSLKGYYFGDDNPDSCFPSSGGSSHNHTKETTTAISLFQHEEGGGKMIENETGKKETKEISQNEEMGDTGGTDEREEVNGASKETNKAERDEKLQEQEKMDDDDPANIERIFSEIDTKIRYAARGNRNLEKDKFLTDYGKYLGLMMTESVSKKNILHILAGHVFKEELFPGWIIDDIAKKKESETRDSLLKLLADRMHTMPGLALPTAIRWMNEPFIKKILSLELGDNEKTLRSNLGELVKLETQENCIHWAINNLSQDLTVRLIHKAEDDACLLAVDSQGYTPLHRAVEYPSCLKKLEIIKALLKYGDKTLDVRCREGLSVYQYYEKKKAEWQNPAKIEEAAQKSSREPTELNRTQTTTNEILETSTAPIQDDNFSRYKSKAPLEQKEEEKRIEQQIEDEIKLQYMRSTFNFPKEDQDIKSIKDSSNDDGKAKTVRDIRSVYGFLYDKGKEKYLSLTMLHGPSSMNKFVFEEAYGYKDFDSTLHHVAIRRVTFKQDNQPGRSDMQIPFALLKVKGVRHIVKVIVFDLKPPHHTDESIENCLSWLESVEILDWRKLDLCPETIYKTCPKVVELHLHWSGNNTALVAWSASDGLCKLERLKEIHLHQTQRIESAKRDKENLRQFEKRLMKVRTTLRLDKYPPSRQKTSLVNVLDMWPDIVVNNLHTTTHNPQLTQSVVRQRRQHAWLTIMKKVADGIKLINIKSIQLPDDFTDDVRVALIDDGVDITNKNITHQIYNGWTCDTGYEGDGLEGIPRPYTSSETEHGTFMASTICRICPKAKIFVFRLNVVSPPGERAHFTAKSAAEALEMAIEPSRKFDIISMSWTIARNQKNKEDLRRLEKHLRTASETKKVLLFCAAPDSGDMTKSQAETFYPFGCSLGVDLFRMAAATVDGIHISMAGSQFDYSLPGHEVEESGLLGEGTQAVLRNQSTAEDDYSSFKTGSSIATALGAGLAALIIHCVKIGVAYGFAQVDKGPRRQLDLRSLEIIKNPSQMRQVFDRMINSNSGDRFINVWDPFQTFGEKLEIINNNIKTLEEDIDLEGENKVVLEEAENARIGLIMDLASKFVNTLASVGHSEEP